MRVRAHLDSLRSKQGRHHTEHSLGADERRREQLPPPSGTPRIHSAHELTSAKVGERSTGDGDGCGIAGGPAGRLYADHLHSGGVIAREIERGGGRSVPARMNGGT